MSGLLLCHKQAKKPYFINEADKNIYSIEELAYFLYNNVYAVSTDFFKSELISYIGEELEIKELAAKLEYYTTHEASFAELMILVVNTATYYSTEEMSSFKEILGEVGNKSYHERQKVKADMLFKSGRYTEALKVYKNLLSSHIEVKTGTKSMFQSEVWKSIGSIYARQFLFEEAVRCYKIASDLHIDNEILKKMIIAALLSEDDKTLSDIEIQYQIAQDDIEFCKNEIDKKRKQIIIDPEYKTLTDNMKYEGNEELKDYRYRLQKMLEEWKTAYRQEMV